MKCCILVLRTIMFICLLFVLTACGRNRQDNTQRASDNVSTGGSHTLTIFTPNRYSWDTSFAVHTAEYLMAAEWAKQGRNFNIDVTSYTRRERDTALTRLQVMIMAGQIPDIIMLDHTPWQNTNSLRNFLGSGAFTDIYTLMDNCPNTSREDFYTSILEAWEINGKLFALPVTFGFDYVGINANLPPSIINQFSSADTISMHELLQIYIKLQEIYGDEFGHLTIFNNLRFSSPFHIISHSMNGFVDFDNGISNLNSLQFISLLKDWYYVFNGRGLFDFEDPSLYGWGGRRLTNLTSLSLYTSRYVFMIEERMLGPVNALIPNSNPHFIYYIPITDEQGRLRISHSMYASILNTVIPHFWGAGHMVVPLISASADGAVAWEYLQHFIYAIVQLQKPDYRAPTFNRASTLVSPIRRDYFQPHVMNILQSAMSLSYRWCRRRPGFQNEVEQAQLIDAAIARLAIYNEMPVTPPFFIPSGLFGDLLETFLRTPPGVFGAQQTAQELHNRVSLWLIE